MVTRERHIQIFGGMGDVLAITPSLRALKEQSPEQQLVLHCVTDSHRNLLHNNPYVDEFQMADRPSGWLRERQTLNAIYQVLRKRFTRKQRQKVTAVSVGALGTYAVYRKPMAEIIADGLGVELSSGQLEIFLTEQEQQLGSKNAAQYQNPVVINPTIRSRVNSTWPISRWAELVAQFPEHDFLQVGLDDEQLIPGAIDLRAADSSKLRELLALLSNVKAYVGMDTFWQHAAAALRVPGVVLHGDGEPSVFGHAIHSNIYKNLRCAPCLPRLGDSPCPYNVECIAGIEFGEVASKLASKLKAGC